MPVLPKRRAGNLELGFSAPAFILGFLATSFQIFLLREFSARFYGNELTFGLVFAAWLLWGGLGSLWATRRAISRAGLAIIFLAVSIVSPMCFAALRFSRFVLGILPGETTGLAPVLIYALGLALLMSAPLGMIFVFAAKHERSLPRVYFWESTGAALSGLVAYGALIPFFSNWGGLALAGSASILAVVIHFRGRQILWIGLAALACMFALFVLDFPSEKAAWQPFSLVRSRDTLYGKLQVVQTSEQTTLYDNELRVYSYPDWSTAEEAVHFALLQNPDASTALLIGGGAGGSLAEILKYPGVNVEYVELDPEMIRLSQRSLPEAERGALLDPRVRITFADGRRFLEKTNRSFDIVLLNLPEPSTAQINRFFTREFFRLVRKRLSGNGIFSVRVPSAENYISPDLQRFLAALYFTLRDAFSEVKVVPGDSNIFLAADVPLTIDGDVLGRTLVRLGLRNKFVTPEGLRSRLHPLRTRALAAKIEGGPRALNEDLHPICYYFSSILWSSQLRGLETKVLTFLAAVPAHWLLDIPLFLFLSFLIFTRLKSRAAARLVPVAVMGVTTMASEIMILIWFQASTGYLYGGIAIFLTAFMAGLALGALSGARRRRRGYSEIVLLQAGLLLFVLTVKISLAAKPPALLFFAFVLALGYLGGDFFIVSNRLFLGRMDEAGLGYGWDLLGSFAAAVGLSAVLIPLAGLAIVFNYLFLLNSFGLLFLVIGKRPTASP